MPARAHRHARNRVVLPNYFNAPENLDGPSILDVHMIEATTPGNEDVTITFNAPVSFPGVGPSIFSVDAEGFNRQEANGVEQISGTVIMITFSGEILADRLLVIGADADFLFDNFGIEALNSAILRTPDVIRVTGVV